MLSEFERHCSVVSLLLIAGAGLIIFQGPVGAVYGNHPAKPASVSVVYGTTESDKTATISKSITTSAQPAPATSAANAQPSILGSISSSGSATDTAAK